MMIKKQERKAPGRASALYRTVVLCLALCAALTMSGCSLLLSSLNAREEGRESRQTEQSGHTETESGLPAQEKDTDSAFGPSSAGTEAPRDQIKIPTETSGEHYSVREIAAAALDAVVEIRTEAVVNGSYFRQYVTSGAGSGVIIDDAGHIVTNNHVIENATSITVRLHNGTEYEATLVGTDPRTDIAVISIRADGLTAAKAGDSDRLEVGDPLVAIGNPLGELGGTVTNGIVSALARQISIDGQKMTLLQTNAAINPGNSGGGLFNDAAELIGIVNAKYSDEGIEGLGFAIPINTARPIIEDLLTWGYVRGRVDLGAEFVDVYSSYNAYYYGVSEYGTYVYSVETDSDAARAGLRSGDIVREIDGVAVTSADQITAAIASHQVGDTVTMTLTRFTTTGSGYGKRKTSEDMTVRIVLTEYVPAYVGGGLAA